MNLDELFDIASHCSSFIYKKLDGYAIYFFLDPKLRQIKICWNSSVKIVLDFNNDLTIITPPGGPTIRYKSLAACLAKSLRAKYKMKVHVGG
jgi:hypothetical protein